MPKTSQVSVTTQMCFTTVAGECMVLYVIRADLAHGQLRQYLHSGRLILLFRLSQASPSCQLQNSLGNNLQS
jgi:hypothetical protein